MTERPNVPRRPFVVGLEGPCCAGKTTLLRGLVTDLDDLKIVSVLCFADFVGGGRFLPNAEPASAIEDRDGLEVLLGIELDRTQPAMSSDCDLILVDRSIHTLLGHRTGLERVHDLTLVPAARTAMAVSQAPLWPDLVIYLDVPQDAVDERNRGKFPDGSIFINPRYNSGVRAYFEQLNINERVLWLDGTLERATLVSLARTGVRDEMDKA